MSDNLDRERVEWVFAPVACAALLTAGAIAGVVRGLRHGGRDQCGGIPLPRCRWLTSRWAVRLAAWCALTAGVADLIIASNCFLHGWRDDVPPNLLSLVLATYALLAISPVIAVVGLTWRDMPQVHGAFVLVVKIALLGGLAAGLASEVLCETGEPAREVSTEWRKGCATLGASAGLMLLGLYGVQADFQDVSAPLPMVRRVTEPEDEEPGYIRHRWPSWRGGFAADFDAPTIRRPSDIPQVRRPSLRASDLLQLRPDPGLEAPLLGSEAPGVSAIAPRDGPMVGGMPGQGEPGSSSASQSSGSKMWHDPLPVDTPSTCGSPAVHLEDFGPTERQ
uniref:Uncharacterized protein n=1 Tax=Alexandrium monilatum TaxID=311494 RepID=A0A7S4SPF8_9DINO|mmetsp:Transcript_1118/g.3722  ORF Transcript_1118/g.3722 Transcript_1118/m.3722 type:complete len:335 (+) Transcript_1118:72-1076(+)|eukprot:CAMPEP_0175224046 /NCGR_PEP_ID=MMETSP0093-20121207/21646_1 /TAXON_ID=311494 /ORGANISM="Alexandrium monilatum, Strain CCMP3105" /LENGTH=334 /DNA_ID=CAMNT_0016517669 /DNA_START=67 /DNA_END=1071 /DNA_ORIENTATION=+